MDNIYLNRLVDHVKPLNVAVGEKARELEMMADQDTVNRVVSEGVYSGKKVIVPVVTIDETLAGRVPKLIKIDVEGFETQVIRGATRTLENPKLQAVLMELNGSGEAYGFDEKKIHNNMLKLGFQQCAYDSLTRSLQVSNDRSWYTGNNLYVRDPNLVQALLTSAKSYSVIGLQI
jgi:FkbM family methyltransferase